MARVFPDQPEALANTAAGRRDVRLHARRECRRCPAFDVPPGFTIESYFEKVTRDGFAERRKVLEPLAEAGRLRYPARRLRGAAGQGDRRHPPGGLRRLLPDRLGLHPLRARARDPGGPGPRLGGGQPRRLRAGHHRHRPDRVRPALRALPEPGAHQPARHRHRLLREPARRGDRVRHPEVRPRERGPDHHLRDHEGEGGGARRRPRAGHELRRRRQASPR